MVEYSVIHSNFMRRGVLAALVIWSFVFVSTRPSIHPPRPTSPHAVTTQSALNPDFLSAFSPLSSLPSSIERSSQFDSHKYPCSRHPLHSLRSSQREREGRTKETLPSPTSFRGRWRGKLYTNRTLGRSLSAPQIRVRQHDNMKRRGGEGDRGIPVSRRRRMQPHRHSHSDVVACIAYEDLNSERGANIMRRGESVSE